MFIYNRLFTYSQFLILFSNCGVETKETKAESSSANISELVGTWHGDCQVEDGENGDDSDHVSKTSFMFNELGVVTSTNFVFTSTDKTCSSAPISFTTSTSNYTVGKSLTTPVGAKEFDVEVTSFTVTIKTQSELEGLNQDYPKCKFELNVAKEIVENKDCPIMNEKEGEVLKKGKKYFGAYKLASQRLTFDKGDVPTNDGSTAEKRSTDINTKEFFLKKNK